MHFSFDLHGVLDADPVFYKAILQMYVAQGHTVSVMSGPEKKKVLTTLKDLGYIREVHFHHVISILEYLRFCKVTLTTDSDGNVWADYINWWSSKGKLCKEFEVDAIYDNSPEYAEFMPDTTRFFLILPNKPHILDDMSQKLRIRKQDE
jgi:hypothetical protein